MTDQPSPQDHPSEQDQPTVPLDGDVQPGTPTGYPPAAPPPQYPDYGYAAGQQAPPDPYAYQEGYSYPPAQPEKPKTPAWVWLAIVALALALAGALFYIVTQRTTVPDVVGMTQEDALASLEESDLELGRTNEVTSDDVRPGLVAEQDPRAGERVARGSAVSVGVAVPGEVDVPDVVGMNEADAALAISDADLAVGAVDRAYDADVPAGEVLRQEPAGGEQAEVGTQVDITVSQGVQTAEVPDVVGLTEDDARDRIRDSGFEAFSAEVLGDTPEGTVVAQSPAAGSRVAVGQQVTIDVSSGPDEQPSQPSQPQSPGAGQDDERTPAQPEPEPEPEPEPAPEPEPEPEPEAPDVVAVPDVVGQNIVSVFFELSRAGLDLLVEWEPRDDELLRAVAQDPAAQTEVEPNSAVTVTFGAPSFLFPDAE